MVDALRGASPIAGNGAASASVTDAGRKLVGTNFDSFLKMLTTQMTNQNPMSPMSTQEFTTQLVQFSQVEQLMNVARTTEKSVSVQESTNLLQAAELKGSTVRVRSDLGVVRNGRIEMQADVPANTTQLRVTVADSLGRVVVARELAPGTGTRSISIPAIDDLGTPMTDAAYRVAVTGRNGNGLNITIPTTASIAVTGVERGGSGVALRTQGGTVALTDVISFE